MPSAEPTTARCAVVARRLAAAGVIAPGETLRPFGGGADNALFTTRAVDGIELVVKIHRRGRSSRHALAHWASTRLAASGVPVPVTRWYDDEAQAETRCPGTPLATTCDKTTARIAGRVLRQIHNVPVAGYGRLRPGGSGRHANWHAWLLTVPADGDLLAQRAHAAIRNHARLVAEGGPRLLHGDWTARHVIADAAGKVTGVVDLESVRGGDPLADLAAWSLREPAPLTEGLLNGYFPAGPSATQCAALAVYRVRIALSLLSYHHARGDAGGARLRVRQLRADLDELDACTPRPIPAVTPERTAT